MHKCTNSSPDKNIGSVISVRGDSCSGPAEISAPPDRTGGASVDPRATLSFIGSETQRLFDSANASCRAVNSGRGYFHRRKTNVVAALDPAYELFLTVLAYPELEVPLRQLDILKERRRRLGPNKTCLACMYVSMQPVAPEDYKDCSAYASYLLQAEFEKKSSDEFKDWAKTARLKECLRDVRARKRAACAKEPSEDGSLYLSIRCRAKSVCGSLDGDKFELSPRTLASILELISADRSGRGSEAQDAAGGINA